MFYKLNFKPKMRDYLRLISLLLNMKPLHITLGFPSQNHVFNFNIALKYFALTML